jgi:hypothetical protein
MFHRLSTSREKGMVWIRVASESHPEIVRMAGLSITTR